ncbi:uncharacterized protein LOC127698482 [Mytilus californianus]|uniref:uncharacterized protein LOC127698482 n=1 Tax=Mytilus californianus TaxID=6549 RepID=UPI0022477F7B|nr:uncharacterized protein LOC127698482 [Mytilus californianus]
MNCPDNHCCKGGCYQYCRKGVCTGNERYNSNCGFPLRNVDCIDDVHYSMPSCEHNGAEIDQNGILFVRPGCKATFKICSGPAYQPRDFPAVPNFWEPFPVSKSTLAPPTSTFNNSINNKGHIIKPANNHTSKATQENSQNTGNSLHTKPTIDMSDNGVVMEDLVIGIGIGAVFAVIIVLVVILCWKYYLKRQKRNMAESNQEVAIPVSNQTDNPLYSIDVPNAIDRSSSRSDHRYDEILSSPEPDALSRTFSEPKYESIKSRNFYNGNNTPGNRRVSDQSSLYQTFADTASTKRKVEQAGSDIVYNTYFRDSAISNTMSTSSSHKYFILDPDELTQPDTHVPQMKEIKENDEVSKPDETYFVLEKTSEQ